jgi:hypothetical protein
MNLFQQTGLLKPIEGDNYTLRKFDGSYGEKLLITFNCGNTYELTQDDVFELQKRHDAMIKTGMDSGLPFSLVNSEVHKVRILKEFLREIHDNKTPL